MGTCKRIQNIEIICLCRWHANTTVQTVIDSSIEQYLRQDNCGRSTFQLSTSLSTTIYELDGFIVVIPVQHVHLRYSSHVGVCCPTHDIQLVEEPARSGVHVRVRYAGFTTARAFIFFCCRHSSPGCPGELPLFKRNLYYFTLLNSMYAGLNAINK